MLRNANRLDGFKLHARDGVVGEVRDVYFDDHRWIVRYFVVDTGAWLEGRAVLVSPAAVTMTDWDRGEMTSNLTREQVKNSPSVESSPALSREREAALLQYYNWPAYWGAASFMDVGMALPSVPTMAVPLHGIPGAITDPQANPTRTAAGVTIADAQLRSGRAIVDYHIEATDGGIGHVEDLLLDESTWEIRFVVVDTRNWWPGKRVIIAPEWADHVGWDDGKVYVHLTRAAVKGSPTYDSAHPVTSDYSRQVHDHYGRPPRDS
jgi:hypothetical protein